MAAAWLNVKLQQVYGHHNPANKYFGLDSITLRQVQGLSWMGPRKALLTATIFKVMSQHPSLPKQVQDWRTRKLQPDLHRWQAALFCFGRKCMEVQDKWAFAAWPKQDSPVDFVLRQTKPDGSILYEQVQFKELVPDEIAPKQRLQDLLDELPQKYPSAGGLTVAIHLHRNTVTAVHDLKRPELLGGSLWLFGLGGKPPHNAFLFGDWLKSPAVVDFTVPRFSPGESLTQWRSTLDDED